MGSFSSKTSDPEPQDRHDEEEEEEIINDELYLLDSGENSDMILLCDDERRLAHRRILSAHSDVFKVICDSLNDNKNVVPISDISSKSLKQMLHYLYSGKLPKLPIHDAIKLIGAAQRYEVLPLKKKCLKIIKQIMKKEDVCDVLDYAYMQEIGELKDIVISYLDQEKKFLASKRWQGYSKSHMEVANDVMLAIFAKGQQ